MKFGQLKDMDLREVWPYEANNFTPWLAENLSHLAEAIRRQNGPPAVYDHLPVSRHAGLLAQGDCGRVLGRGQPPPEAVR